MTRYLQDAQLELYDVERTIASNRKTAMNNPNPKSAGIADAVLPSLERKRDALKAEIAAGLPERPSHYAQDGWKGTAPPPFPACCIGTQEPIPQSLLDSLELPAFLKRTA